MGNITDILDAVDVDRTAHYDYDSLDRLVGADGWWGRLDWSYDHTGNRLSETRLDPGATDAAVSSYAYQGGTSRLLTVTGVGSSAIEHALEYDSSGNATRYDDLLLEYDSADRVIAFRERATGALVQENTYDYKFMRTKRVEYLDEDEDGVRETTTCAAFLYDTAGRLTAEHDCTTGAPVEQFTYVAGYRLGAVRYGAGWFWFVSDHLPAPRKLLGADQLISWDGRMEPFGSTDEVVLDVPQPIRFPGQHDDYLLSLVHNGRRIYAPATGSYVQADPLAGAAILTVRHSGCQGPTGTTALASVYAYASGNPTRFTDPTGLDVACTQLGIFGVVPIWTNMFDCAYVSNDCSWWEVVFCGGCYERIGCYVIPSLNGYNEVIFTDDQWRQYGSFGLRSPCQNSIIGGPPMEA